MSETPRTDAEDSKPINSYGDCEFIQFSRMRDFARTLERELEQEKKWKAEDPRMLREQIRVADVAFNGLNERHNKALAELERSQSTARDMRSTWEFGAKVMGKLVIPRAHQMSPGEIPFEFLERVFTQVESLKAQLAECQAARARLSDPTVDARNSQEPTRASGPS